MKTIDFGIDLGTTNSSIARFSGTEIRIFKNKDQMETTPSVVRIDATGRVLVGKKAYDSRIGAAGNVALEFKRTMGQSDRFMFKGVSKPWSAEELSAEVLKSLLEDARRLTGETITHAVITVPAAFGQLQCEATARTAKLAGLQSAPLLQEPIAASIAYGMQPDSADKRWLVFDLGGGTLDLALVSTRDGRLEIIEHAGDNQCGGKDIDKLIVEKLILPKLGERFRLPPLHTATSRRLTQAVFKAAEEVKIELTAATTAIASILEAGEDLDGEEIGFEVEITRADLDALVRPFVLRTVELCRRTLAAAKLPVESLSEILLVGGPTQMPLVREILAAELGVKLTFDIDPMTVVARGAAIYASGLQCEESASGEAAVVGAYQLQLTSEPASMETRCPVIGTLTPPEGGAAKGLAISIEAESGLWSSGWLPLTGLEFETDVALAPKQTTVFRIALRDGEGKLLPMTPDSFVIRHGLAVQRPPLPHTIGAEVFYASLGRTAVDPLFDRSTSLPAERVVKYKARRALLPSDRDACLVIKLWEGEYEDPEANTWLGALTIRAEDIERAIPEGSDIEMHVSIDASRHMEVHAYVPVLDQHFEERVFVPQENEVSFVEKANQLKAQVDELHAMLRALIAQSDRAGQTAARARLVELRGELEALWGNQDGMNLDPDAAKQLVGRVKAIRGEIMRIDVQLRSGSQWKVVLREVNETRGETESVVGRYGNATEQQELAILLLDTDEAAALKDEAGLARAGKEMDGLWWRVVQRQGWYWQNRFDVLKRKGTAFTDAAQAAALLREGEALQGKGDGMQLRSVVERLWNVRPRDAAETLRMRSGESGIEK